MEKENMEINETSSEVELEVKPKNKHLAAWVLGVIAVIFITVFLTLLFSSQFNKKASLPPNEALVIQTLGVEERNEAESFRAGHLLVKFAPGVSKNSQAALISQIGAVEVDRIKGIEVALIKVPEQAQEALLKALNNNSKIEFAEFDALVAPEYVPNDTNYGNQWHHQNINSEAGWEMYKGTEGVTIAIGDTGINSSHEDLLGRVIGTHNVIDGNSDVTDINGHGTKVAGTAAAIGDNSIGVTGVSYRSNILAIKVSNAADGNAYVSDLAKAVTYAADNGARVINLSFGVCGYGTIMSAANHMESKGGLVTISAGNTGDEVTMFNEVLQTLCVASTDSSDNRTSWSSYGTYVDFTMPGSGIYTTNNSGSYSSVSGTSFSSPMLAGVVALIMSINPDLGPEDVKTVLKNSARDLGEQGWDKYYGWGIIDVGVAAALAASGTRAVPDTENPTINSITPQDGTTVSGIVEIAVDAVDNERISRVSITVRNNALQSVHWTDDMSAPYVTQLDTTKLDNGTYTISVWAYDINGNSSFKGISVLDGEVVLNSGATIEVLNIPDTESPTLSILSPAEGEVLPSKGSFTISTEASDNVDVDQISIAFDGVVYGNCSGTTSCETTVSLKRVKAGTYTIDVTASDVAGNITTKSVSVTVGDSGGGGKKPGGGGSDGTDDGSGGGGNSKCSPWPSCRN